MNVSNTSFIPCLPRRKGANHEEKWTIPRVHLDPEVLRELYIAINFIQMQNSVANNPGRK